MLTARTLVSRGRAWLGLLLPTAALAADRPRRRRRRRRGARDHRHAGILRVARRPRGAGRAGPPERAAGRPRSWPRKAITLRHRPDPGRAGPSAPRLADAARTSSRRPPPSVGGRRCRRGRCRRRRRGRQRHRLTGRRQGRRRRLRRGAGVRRERRGRRERCRCPMGRPAAGLRSGPRPARSRPSSGPASAPPVAVAARFRYWAAGRPGAVRFTWVPSSTFIASISCLTSLVQRAAPCAGLGSCPGCS